MNNLNKLRSRLLSLAYEMDDNNTDQMDKAEIADCCHEAAAAINDLEMRLDEAQMIAENQ